MYNNNAYEVHNMKKGKLFLAILSSALLLVACNSNEKQPTSNSQTSQQTSSGAQEEGGKIKEIALKTTARTTLSVTERIGTITFFEIKANKGQSLKTADKKVTITSSNPEVLFVENTGAVISTYLEAKKPGTAKLTIQSTAQEDIKLEE